MPVHGWSHDEFPESLVTAQGVREIDGGPAGGRHLFVQLDLTYTVKDSQPLRVAVIGSGLDWATTNPDISDPETYPLVVFVQGSGWQEQQLGVNLLPLTEIARRGYVVALVEHRPSSMAAFPAQVADVLTAISGLRHAARGRSTGRAGQGPRGSPRWTNLLDRGAAGTRRGVPCPPLPRACTRSGMRTRVSSAAA